VIASRSPRNPAAFWPSGFGSDSWIARIATGIDNPSTSIGRHPERSS
jgi:hypothetical protein